MAAQHSPPREFPTGATRRKETVPKPWTVVPRFPQSGEIGDPSSSKLQTYGRAYLGPQARAVAATSGATRLSHPRDPTPTCVRPSSPSAQCLQFATLGSHLHPSRTSPAGAGGGPRGWGCLLKGPRPLPLGHFLGAERT